MSRTITRPRRTARAAALGALALALAAGCSGTGEEEGGAPAAESGTAQEGEDGADDGATDDGAAGDGGDGGGASDGGGAGEGTDDTGQDGADSEALPADADLATEELPITAEQAIDIATETVGGGDLVQIEIDHDDRTWEWELEIVLDGTQHELDIDATTGEVTQHDTDDDEDQEPVVDVTSPLAYAEAIEIAVGEAPGRVSGWDLDSDDGTIRYQVDIERSEGGDVEVEIDVETGETRIDD